MATKHRCPDAVVELFVTTDGGVTLTPAADIDGNAIEPRTTGGDGLYNFANLKPGEYVVRVTPPAGYATTVGGADPDNNDNTDSNGLDVAVGKYVQTLPIQLTAGSEPADDGDGDANSNLSVDFGFYQTYTLGDFVWLDQDADGIQEEGEPGIKDVIVELFNGDGTATGKTTKTNEGGFYEFTELQPGDYYLVFTPPDNYQVSPVDSGSDDLLDSDVDPTTGRTANITVTSGEDDTSWDAGMYPLSAIGNYVWNDVDGDGIQGSDPNETPLADVTVRLYDGNENLIAETTSDANGFYGFTDLPPGDYFVEFVTPKGLAHTRADQGTDDEVDSDVDQITHRTPVITLSAGENDFSLDAGFSPPTSVGNFVWDDGPQSRANGIRDDGEPGVSNVTVTLRDANGRIVGQTTTDESGFYLFTELPPGDYTIEFELPEG